MRDGTVDAAPGTSGRRGCSGARCHLTRVRVPEVLAEREKSVFDLAVIVGIEASYLSHQLGSGGTPVSCRHEEKARL